MNKDFEKRLCDYIDNLKIKDEVKILNFVVENNEKIDVGIKKIICDKIGIMEISLENTIKFYPKFRNNSTELKEINICTGLSCGNDGGKRLFNHFLEKLEVDENGYSKDKKILLTQSRCLGKCRCSPNAKINNKLLSMTTIQEIEREL